MPYSFCLESSVSEDSGGFFLPARQQRYPLHIRHADYLFYDEANGTVHGTGNVLMTYGNDTLKSDEFWYVLKEKKYYAKGNVIYYRIP